MMLLRVPRQNELLARLVFHLKANPLLRPKVNFHNRSLRQPLDNQRELLDAVKLLEPLAIEEPVIVQIIVNWPVPETKTKQKPHPCSRHLGDIDNLAKAIHDAIVKANVIVDDKYIVGSIVSKAWGKEDAIQVGVWSVLPQTQEASAWEPLSFDRISGQPSQPQLLT